MSRKDFNRWLLGKPDWSTISWEYTTGANYQSNQDLKAVFYNSYTYFEDKVTKYFDEFEAIPIEVINDLVFDFQKHFPKENRIVGINYFDDLMNLLIDKLQGKTKKTTPQPKTDYWEQDAVNETTVNEFEKAINKIVQKTETEKDLDCFQMRLRMLPRTVLNESSFSIERKKYLLKRMFLVLKENETNPLINQLLKDFVLNIEPYSEIYAFLNKEPQQENTSFKFENEFDNVDTKEIYNHFYKGLVKSNMLNENELQAFLIAAFQEKKPPERLFNLKGVETKGKVMKVFYQYYKDVAAKPRGKQKEYAGLLGSYFNGYKTGTVSSNFSKYVY